MGSRFEELQTLKIDEAQPDSTPPPRLESEFFRHTRYVEKGKNRNETMKEEWSNCGELGRGGFGVVHKQIQKATGHYRAVKTIDKGLAFPLDCSREHLVMAKLAKVCVLTRGNGSSLLLLRDCFVF